MRKKFTMLLMSLLAFVGVAKAGVTDFPTMSEGENIKWYTISNTRSASGKYLYWTESGVKDSNTRTGASFFYVTGSADACYIHNYATDLLFSGNGAWTAEGVACKLSASSHGTGLLIAFNGTYLNEQNFNDAYTTYWDVNDLGSIFVFEEVTDFSAIIDVPAAKTAAKATLEDLALIPVFTAAATEAIAEVDAVEAEGTGLAELNAAVEEINAIVAASKKESLEGKFFTLYTAGRSQYAKMTATGTAAAATATTPDFIWQFVENNGAYNIYNPYTGKYLGALGSVGGPSIAVTANQAEAGAYNIAVVKDGEDAKVTFGINGAYIHLNGSLLPWYGDGGASYWTIAEVSDFTEIINNYKASVVETLDSWKNLSVVFDAELIDGAKTAINNIASTNFAAIAAIDAELKKVTDDVAAKNVVFRNSNTTDANRSEVYLATDMSDNKGRGNKEFDYNAVWSLQSAGGTSFYLYNDLNKVYLGTPGSEGALTSAPAAAFTFEVVDANTSLVEIKTGGQTMHVHNWADCTLTNYDGDETASRWYVSIIDIAADIQELIDANVGNHAEEPELGEYPTAAYNALVAAKSTVKTAEEVAVAIAEFKASLNRPVYIITSAWDAGYSAGAAIYYDGAWKWKKANKYDKQMWMTLPGYTEEDVPAAVDAYNASNPSYGFCDYLTGTKMRDKDVQLVKITGWEGAYSLQYNADANSTDAAQHAASGGTLVNWKTALVNDRQASAWKVEYVGNTYDLDQLVDEQLQALTGLQNAFDSKVYLFDAVVGDGIGQYKDDNGTLSTMLQDLFDMIPILNEKLSNLNDLEMTIEEINATAAKFNSFTVEANMPEEGKYYRIYGANSNVSPAAQYITGHTNADGGRIALTADADASTIYYYKDGKLQAYQSKKFLALSSTHYTFDMPATDGKEAVEASAIEFAASSYIAGAYTIKSADRYLHYKVYNGAVEIDRCQAEESANDSWYLVEVEKQTVTYIYKAGETELARQEVTEFAGMPYPAADATLPLGYTAEDLEGNIAVGETEKVIACTLNAEAIPFNYYESFADVEQWYYLNFTAAKNYLYYDADNTVLDATKTEIDRTNREAYAWAFIGTPATGFQVVNKLAGNAKGLKALKSDAVTGAVVGEGAHTFKVTASTYSTGGFFMAATNGESADRFNKQGNPAKVVYWTGADAGSTFTVTECPFGAVAELEALIVAAEALKTTVDANTGDKIGEYATATGEALAAAIETAKTKGDAATAEDVTALQAAMDAVKIILPTAGKYYQFHSAVAFADTKAVYSGEGKALWKTLNDDDKVFYWEAVENEGGIALKNAKDGKFLNGNAGQSGAWSVSDTPANIDVIIITKDDNEKGYQYGLVLNNWQMHANQHGEGSGTASNIVSWNNTEVGKASAWYIKEVELPEFCDIVYEFKHEGVTIDKFTQRAELKAGAEFPEIAISLPYGVSTNATKPDGTVTTSQTFEFTLNIDKALPFETAADADNITTWYYVQMHVFNASYLNYIQDCDTYVEWADNNVTDEEIDSHLWGFVGSIWDGVQVVNKATNKAIVSTGSGDATMGDEGTVFMPTHSANAGNADYFCLQHASGNYLNAQNDRIKHYSQNDNGSTFFVTEADKEFSVTVNAEAGYSTYYSNYRLAIPETVTAYIIDKVDGKSINLKQVEGVVLPANTGIILEGAGTHTFVTSAAQTADVSGNLLKGTAVKTLITAEENTNYYVLAMPEGEEVGLYKAALNKDANGNKVEGGVAFHNGANKAYLPVVVEDAAEAPAMFSFGRGEGTTSIENAELATDNAELVIYDLTGRRVEKMVKGIYIVNGKKVLVK